MSVLTIKTSLESGKILENNLPNEYIIHLRNLSKTVRTVCQIESNEYEALKLLMSLASDFLEKQLTQKKDKTIMTSPKKVEKFNAMEIDNEMDWKTIQSSGKKPKISEIAQPLNPKAEKFVPTYKKENEMMGDKRKFKQKQFKFPWKKGKTFWLRKKDGGERLDGSHLKKLVDFLNSQGYNVQHWISLAVGGIKFSVSNQIKVPLSLEFENTIYEFWFPSSELKKSLVIYRIRNIEEEELKKLIDEEFHNLNLINLEYRLERLGSRKSGQWKPTSAFRICDLNEDVISFLLNRKFISIDSKAAPIRLFIN